MRGVRVAAPRWGRLVGAAGRPDAALLGRGNRSKTDIVASLVLTPMYQMGTYQSIPKMHTLNKKKPCPDGTMFPLWNRKGVSEVRLVIAALLIAGLGTIALAQGCRNMSCTSSGGITTCVCF